MLSQRSQIQKMSTVWFQVYKVQGQATLSYVLNIYGLEEWMRRLCDAGHILFLGLGYGITHVFILWKFFEFYIHL